MTPSAIALRRSPRNHQTTFLEGNGEIDLILNSKYNKKNNTLTLLVSWAGIDGEYWVPIENLYGSIEDYPFLDPITRAETIQLYETYHRRALSDS